MPPTRERLTLYGKLTEVVYVVRDGWDEVVLAEYHCHYAWQDRKVTALRDGIFYPTRFMSPQGSLIPVTPPTFLVRYHPRSLRGPHPLPVPARQLLLFEVVATA